VVAPEPAATLSAKVTPAKDTPSSFEATATWSGLDPGEYVIVCVTAPISNELGGAVGVAANDGKQSTTLTVPIPTKMTGVITATTARLASAPQRNADPTKTCESGDPPPIGQPATSSILIKNEPGLG
jgi:hypothetical protein